MLSGKAYAKAARAHFPVIDRVHGKFENERANLGNHPTGQLWRQYMDMVNVFRNLIRSERTGDWSLHLSVLAEMISYFAATSHRNYAKSVQIFMQDMVELKVKDPLICSLFEKGLFVVRRSEGFGN
ncbi:hypothetical protein SNE40_007329 [Patella caerulea]|uniref:Uncharacterized protein n=1 Tax=Patella caerulea TaxID=87958 RepID=A0AAN8JTK5_PATCE